MRQKRDEIQDFLKDEHFVQWVLRPDKKTDAYWKAWIRENPEKLKEVRLAREMISSFRYQHSYRLPQDTHDNMLNRLRTKQVLSKYDKPKKASWYVRIAASVLIAILGGMGVWQFSQESQVKETQPVPLVVKRTQKGEKLTVRLPDGSTVKLNANSILVFPEVFAHKTRYIKLEGEALFEVARDAARPFIITSGGVETRVLGTSFNIRAYEDESEVAVAVVSGKVSVKGSGTEQVQLSPNEVSYYHKADASLMAKKQDVSDLIAWTKNILIFHEDPAEEVWKKLEDWYGVNIIVPKTQVIQGNYSGRYHNESLERVLDGISYASEFSYEIQENKNVIIKVLPMKNKKAS
ncbi:transmembrane sensor [Catalinimonas alkaloidigena]|uniref:FecR family protein n=1 Tax=Catalinimonas alkaloidigena TaxID=1075417 RepID=UPI0024077201|nr:FecR family protein [Catalinimonas alkaloidigena]MDF9799608.1 transmembrane sensor [Catalinimonas alkaloidigena]